MMLCTGNPDDHTLASAVRTVMPDCHFASRATGYDLTFWTPGSEDHFQDCIKNYNIFINSSFICGGGQLNLLETAHRVWTANQIRGHIINIGSSAEYMGVSDQRANDPIYGTYSIQKRALRDRSLQLNRKNGIKTSHITAGGLNDGKPDHDNWLPLEDLARIILWIVNNPNDIPIIGVERNG